MLDSFASTPARAVKETLADYGDALGIDGESSKVVVTKTLDSSTGGSVVRAQQDGRRGPGLRRTGRDDPGPAGRRRLGQRRDDRGDRRPCSRDQPREGQGHSCCGLVARDQHVAKSRLQVVDQGEHLYDPALVHTVDPAGVRPVWQFRSATARTCARRCWSVRSAARSRCSSTTRRSSTGRSATTTTSAPSDYGSTVPDLQHGGARRGRSCVSVQRRQQGVRGPGRGRHGLRGAGRDRPHRADRRRLERVEPAATDRNRPLVLLGPSVPVRQRLLGRHPDGLRRRVRRCRRRGRPRAHPRLRREDVEPLLLPPERRLNESLADTIGEIVDHRNGRRRGQLRLDPR